MIDLALTNCRPVLPDGRSIAGSILVDDGRIAGLVEDPTTAGVHVRKTVDLGGLPVLPGIIDTHVHIRHGAGEKEFPTETRSAALGGVTTICRFFRNLEPYDESLPAEIELGSRTSYVDFAFHVGILVDDHLRKLQRWVHEYGVRSFKVYTCYKGNDWASAGLRGQDDGFIFDVLKADARVGGVVQIIHCENQEIVDRATSRLRMEHPDSRDLNIWNQARPVQAEVEAIRRVLYLAKEAGAELMVAHLSGADALHTVKEAKATGQAVFAETCPQFLLFDTEAPSGPLVKYNPPVRPPGNQAALWSGVLDGSVDVLGSDHSTTSSDQKNPGDIWASAPGSTGVGTLLPALLHTAALYGGDGLGAIARAQARAADIYRLPGKGRIEPGSDADLVIVDPGLERMVDSSKLESAADFNLFHGTVLKGWPVMTFLRGSLIVARGHILGRPGQGRYLRR